MQRRRLLKVLGAGALVAATGCGDEDPAAGEGGAGGNGQGGAGGAGQGGAGGGAAAEPAAHVSELVQDGLIGVSALRIFLGLDADGVYAMTSLCSHNKCNILISGSILPDGVECGCHGSAFDLNGQVTNGPALVELIHYAVSIDDLGDIWVDTGAVVASDVRTLLPV